MSKRIFTEEQLAALPPSMTRRALGGAAAPSDGPPRIRTGQPAAPAARGMKAMQALGRLEKGALNKTEKAYEEHLIRLVLAGEVLWFKFEPFRIVLAPKTTYTADFLVQMASGHLEVHEVKGFWTDDARVKIKVAAQMLPVFKFVAIKMVKPDKGCDPAWSVEEF